MTVYPLPEQISNEKKLLPDEAIPAAVVTNKGGYTPVSTLAAASVRAQRRLRSFRRLMIILMVIGLLIIAAALAYGLYKGINYKMHHHNFLTSSHVHSAHASDSEHQFIPGHTHHMSYRVVLNGERVIPNNYKPMIEEEADIDEDRGVASIFSPAIFNNGKLYREAGILHIFSPRLTVIRDRIKDKCFIKPGEFRYSPEMGIDVFRSYKGLVQNKIIPDVKVIRQKWFADKPIPQVDVGRLIHPEVSKYCLGRTVYRLIQLPNNGPSVRNIGPPLFGPKESEKSAPEWHVRLNDSPKLSIQCMTRSCPADLDCGVNGQRKDENGCLMCECQTFLEKQLSETQCSEPNCLNQCIFGQKVDERGCKTCDCITQEDDEKVVDRKKREAGGCEEIHLDEGFFPSGDNDLMLLDINYCE